MSEERRRLIRKVLVLSWGRDGGEKACSVSGATDRDGVALGQEGEGETGICVMVKTSLGARTKRRGVW